MDPKERKIPGVMQCVGNNCNSDPRTWPLHYARQGDVFSRLCSSCVLISYRSLYCCCCFLLLGPAPPAHIDDPLVAPHEATAICIVCRGSVAHLSCIDYSTAGVFACPVCIATAMGMPFSYAPSCEAPLDTRGARVLLLSTRIALVLLRKEAAHAKAEGERMAVESAKERKEAYRALSLAFGIDTNIPSMNKHLLPAKNLGKEPQIDMAELDLGKEPQIDMANLDLGKKPHIDMANLDLGKEPQTDMAKLDLNEPHIVMAELDLNEPAPPASPEACTEGVCEGTAMAFNKPPTPSMVRYTFGMDGLRREPAVASSSNPQPSSMPTFIYGGRGARWASAMASTQPPLPSTEPPLSTLAALTLGMEGVNLFPPRAQNLQLFSKDNDEMEEE